MVTQLRHDRGRAQPELPALISINHLPCLALPAANDQLSARLSGDCPYPDDYFMGLIPDYERLVYPVNPIITSSEIIESIKLMRTEATHAALVYAFAAATVDLSQASWQVNSDVASRIRDLVSRSHAAYRQIDPGDGLQEMRLSIRRIMSCVFLGICMMAFNRFDRSFVFVREAIAMIQMLRIDRYGLTEKSRLGDTEVARRQRLYWEAFIHERFLTMSSNCPSILPPLRTGLPLEDPSIPLHIHVGFSRIIHLFLIIDDNFLAHWAAQDDPHQESRQVSAAWIELKQKELDDDETSAVAETDAIPFRATAVPGLTELQHADLFVTRTWLRTLVWQLAMSNCLLSSKPPTTSHEAMSLVFPVRRLSSQLRQLVTRPEMKTSIGMHGLGIVQKLFEIANTIADVMALVPAAMVAENEEGVEYQRIADLLFLVKTLFSFERIDQVQRSIIKQKVENLRRIFPHVEFERFD